MPATAGASISTATLSLQRAVLVAAVAVVVMASYGDCGPRSDMIGVEI